MSGWKTHVSVVAGFALAALIGGAVQGAASTTEGCSGGRAFCVAVTDTDGVSPSVAGAHYMSYTVHIANVGKSSLTNGRVELTLTDLGGGAASTAVFQPAPDSTSLCSVAGPSNVLSCLVPNLPRGGSVTYEPLVFTTSETAGTTATRMTAEVSFKEKGSDNQPIDPQQDRVIVFDDTSYEASGDIDRSFAFANSNILLGTATNDDQSSVFRVAPPEGTTAFVASLEESSPASSFCPSCFGEAVHTVGGGIFSASNPVELLTVQNFLESGKNEGNIAVRHRRDDGTVEVITAACGTAIGAVPPASKRPCRTVRIDRHAGQVTVTIDAWANGNGDWGFQ